MSPPLMEAREWHPRWDSDYQLRPSKERELVMDLVQKLDQFHP